MLKGISDVDCVVMINSPDLLYLKDVSDMPDYVKEDLKDAIGKIEQAVKKHGSVKGTNKNEFMVTATLKVSGVTVEVDLIPTADNLAAQGMSS